METLQAIPTGFVILGFVGMTLALLCWTLWLHMRLRRLLRGKRGADLEALIAGLGKDVDSLYTSGDGLQRTVSDIEKRLQQSVQHVRIKRFNPFQDSGGDQSFAIALLNEKQDGVVISSFHARDGVRVYAKPITKGESFYPLSHEERTVISRTA